MVKSLLLLIIAVIFLASTAVVEARILPQAAKSGVKQTSMRSTGATIGVYPKLKSDRRALIVSFTNLQNAKSVSYSLIYSHGPLGQQEGAGGALNLTGQTTDRAELLFGTCSAGVCKYHTGIKDARLEVSYSSVNGKKYLKKFRIKI